MAEIITSEQMAKAAWDAITKEADPTILWTAFPSGAIPSGIIAYAIRAAETAAVEAERARCAKIAEDAAANSERGEHPRHEHIGAIGYECACDDIAEAIRATPTTEATHG